MTQAVVIGIAQRKRRAATFNDLFPFQIGGLVTVALAAWSITPASWQMAYIPPGRLAVLFQDGKYVDRTLKRTVTAFIDLECIGCRDLVAQSEENERFLPGLRIYYRQFPIAMHSNAWLASEAAFCAREQGRYYQYISRAVRTTSPLTRDQLEQIAKTENLDFGKFVMCLQSKEMDREVTHDVEVGKALGISGTPTIVLGRCQVAGSASAIWSFVAVELEGDGDRYSCWVD